MVTLILSHERSLNKAECLIRYFKKQGRVILVVEYPIAKHKEYVQLCDQIVVVEGFAPREIILQVPDCQKVFSVSENLLEIQSQIEEIYGIQNLSRDAAQILSNKWLLDQHCQKIGLSEFIPAAVVPSSRSRVLSISGPVIVKPDIGTGSNKFLDENFSQVEYRVWDSSEKLVTYLQQQGLEERFYKINQEGISKERFNNAPCRMMLQEFVGSDVPSYAPSGVFMEGEARIAFFVRNIKIDQRPEKDMTSFDLRKLHCAGVPHGEFGDFAVYSEAVPHVPKFVLEAAQRYITTLLGSLKVKELFFSGPDFHLEGRRVAAIDFNPRPGHFFNLLDAIAKGRLMRDLLTHQDYGQMECLLWVTLPMNLKKIDDENLLVPWRSLIPGELHDVLGELPHFSYLQARPRALQLKIVGPSLQFVLEEYQSLKQEINKKFDAHR